jgi:hypothetical protein
LTFCWEDHREKIKFHNIKKCTVYQNNENLNAHIAATVSLMILRQPGKFIRSQVMPRCCALAQRKQGSMAGAGITCWRPQKRTFCCPAHLSLIPWTKLYGAFLGYMLTKHLTTMLHDNNAAFLMQKIMEMMGSLDRDTMANACRQFWSMVEAMVVDDGNFFR